MIAMGKEADEATRTIIARERRRMAPQSTLEAMVRLLPRADTSPIVTKAIMALGRDGVDAMIEAMNGASSGFERRAYIEALTASRDADPAILASLGSARAELVRDAADVAGRKRLEAAVPTLTHLLKHNDESVRMAAWQALERIGNAAALDALYGQSTAGRNR
jgi:HEAT repeat protein